MAEEKFDPSDIARICSYNPGLFLKEFLPRDSGKGYGRIEEGFIGSLTILNMHKSVRVDRGKLQSKSGWSPFEDMTFPGSVECVIIRGGVCS